MMSTKLISIFAIASVAAFSGAQAKTFTIVGDKLAYRNVATVESVSDYETFTGRTNGVSGWIKLDPKSHTGVGQVEVDVKSIDTGIPLRNEHMQSEGWLNAAKYPTMTFVASKVTHTTGDSYKVTGKLTLHGVTKTVTANAKVAYRAADAETKAKGFEGDVVKLSTKFAIKLSDFGVVIPDMAKGKVSNEVTLSLNAFALAK